MERKSGVKNLAAVCVVALASLRAEVHAGARVSTERHQGAVTAIVASGDDFFSAGADGFMVKWTGDGQGEHWQTTDIPIVMAAVSPDGRMVATYESDGARLNRVSVWDFQSLTRKYARRFSDSVTTLSFSPKGTYVVVGTATVEGVVFLNASTGAPVKKIRDNTGIVSRLSISATEQTLLAYSPSGSISYFDLRTGRTKRDKSGAEQKFQAARGLSQACVFRNNLYVAGTIDDSVVILSAMTGDTLAKFESDSPLIIPRSGAGDLLYLERGRTMSVLRKITANGKREFSPPATIAEFPKKAGEDFVAGARGDSDVMFGAASGDVFKISLNDPARLVKVSENAYEKINDMARAGDDFYFLTGDAVYRSSFDSGEVERVSPSSAQTSMSPFGENIILWSKGTRRAAQLLDTSSGSLSTLFAPENAVNVLRAADGGILTLEGGAVVNLWREGSWKREELYSGAAVQDAVEADGVLYVAKSSATDPPSALVSVDIATKEIAPLKFSGAVAFSLARGEGCVYGVKVAPDAQSGARKTAVFSFNLRTRADVTLISLNDEDTDAFLYLHDGVIFTDIGKSRMMSYDTRTRKSTTYSRSASLPLKAARSDSRVASLNRDGSVSWYNQGSPQVAADWLFTKDGSWREF